MASCFVQKAPEDCVCPMGQLLFDTTRLKWGEVYFSKKYTKIIKVYNPTKKDVFIQVCPELPELLRVNKAGHDSLNVVKDGFLLASGDFDCLLFTFIPVDTCLLGSYSGSVYLKMNGDKLLAPLEMHANILENFELSDSRIRSHDPAIEITKDTFDFDPVLKNAKISISFPIKNNGKSALVIRKIEAECGCTSACVQQNVIRPGESTTLDIVFNTMGKAGLQRKTVVLYCNDPVSSVVKFTIRGYIKE